MITLWVALAALAASTLFYVQSLRGKEGARSQARGFFSLATFAVLLGCAILIYLILSHDFRVHYVFSYSDRALPLGYLISTFWAGQEGSFLLWLACGMLIGLPLIRYARHYEDRTLIVYNLTLLSLLAILVKQSPFRFLEGAGAGQAPFDGQGLNPLLQNPWMTIHPPIMFVGYAATAVPFAFAIAALWGRRYDEWVGACLPWALATVVTLGCAILLGGYWAYVTLGWGGYWGWDPVENSSLVPWIASAALVHGMLLQRARGRFRKLNFALAILGYVLVVYATFLTRSGVLADFSVHSFVDLGITGWLVANLGVFSLAGFGALLWRWREIPAQPGDEPFLSRTVFLVLTIAALLGAAAMVLLGTSAPLITRLASQPSQVSPAFYNQVMLPIGILLALFLGIVPYLGWRGAHSEFRQRTAIALGLAIACTVAGIALGARGTLYLVFLMFSLFAFFSNALRTADEIRRKRLSAAGGYLAHVGLGLMLAGIITSSAYDRTEKVVLPLGESRQALGYTLTFKGVEKPNPRARDAMLVEIKDAAGHTFLARPRMFRNEKSNQLVANPDVKSSLTHDVYIAPIEFEPGREAEPGLVLDLGKGESATAGDLQVTFEGFDMTTAHGEGARIAIGARVLLHRGGETHRLTPILAAAEDTFKAEPLAIPGVKGASLQLAGVNASAGRVRLQLDGVGENIAKRASLHKGETLTYRTVALTFTDFDLSEFEPEAGKIFIGATFKASPSGATSKQQITAVYRSDGAGERFEDAAVPGLEGVRLRLARMDATAKTAEVVVFDPQAPPDPGDRPKFSADLTVKPLIILLWAGLVVLLAGGTMAALRRSEEFAMGVSGQVISGK
ncbi:MAG: cytochrome c biogenesis protein CcsA [Acidobacteriota bacterium]